MNSKRSYLEGVNAGRQRRPQSSLEEINRTLDRLGERFERHSSEFMERPAYRGEDRLRRERDAPRRGNEDLFGRDAGGSGPGATIQQLARNIESARRQEESVASIARIASELKSMREELRYQMNDGLQREFEGLRADIERAVAGAAGVHRGEELRQELERLSRGIDAMARSTSGQDIGLLREEINLVRESLDRLGRQDTMRSVEQRWNDFDRRFDAFEERFADPRRSSDPAIAALNARLEEINHAVNNLPESLSLRTLEEKVRTLATAIDHFSQQQDAASPDAFAMIGERLDEISRAIVASTVANQAPHAPVEQFERIEARIASLARQIDELSDDRPAGEIIDRINVLSQRVDEMSRRAEFPERAVEKLAEQVAIIASRLDAGMPAADAEAMVQGLEQRFSSFTDALQRQGEALQHGESIFRELESRLEELSSRLDQPSAAPADARFMDAIDARFEELTRRFDATAGGEASDRFRNIEARLEEISSRLDGASQPAGVDATLIRSLEEQVAGLAAHLAKPGAPLPEFEDVGPRLAQIERSIETSRETIMASARAVVEEAVSKLPKTAGDSLAVAALAEDLKSLDTLTRRSDERNARTFEAIHDTLIKIVDRLGTLETRPFETEARAYFDVDQTPSTEPSEEAAFGGGDLGSHRAPARSPAQAAAAAASAALSDDQHDEDALVADAEPRPAAPEGKRSMLGGLARAFKREKAESLAGDPARPRMPKADFDLDEPLDPRIANQPLEPGSGAPDLNAIMKRVRDERGTPARDGEDEAAKSDFIAAARRAAQAAAAEADTKKKAFDKAGHATSSGLGRIFRNHRKMALMAAATAVLALAGMQLGKAFLQDDKPVAASPAKTSVAQAPVETKAAPSAMTASEDADIDMASTDESIDASADQPIEEGDLPEELTLDGTPDNATARDDASDADTIEPSGVEADNTVASAADATGSLPPAVTETAQPVSPANGAEADAPATAAIPAPTFDIPADAGPIPLREAAEAGDPKALFEIGGRYAEGRGTKQDQSEAAKWYERAADAGFAPAQYRIGNYYEKGTGVARDVARAKTWYQMAAEQGNASAMHNLAVLYAMGADGTTDNDSAARWFQRAAELGVSDSQFNLGILAAKGVGMPQNLEESYKWFALVAKAGDKDAAAKRDEIANALRPEQLAKAQAAAELWKPKAVVAEANDVTIPAEWTEGQDKTASVDMKQAVRNIQLILNKNGYDAGGADGIMGGKTKSAIVAFQRDNGLPATGDVTEELVHALLKKK